MRLAVPLLYKQGYIAISISAGLFFDLVCVGHIRLVENFPTLQVVNNLHEYRPTSSEDIICEQNCQKAILVQMHFL